MASEKLKIDARRRRILEILSAEGQVRVADLSARLAATPVTIRSDLDALERDGFLERIQGGAVQTVKNYYNLDFLQRKQEGGAVKKHLAAAGLDSSQYSAHKLRHTAATMMLSGGVDACATWSPNSLKILEEMPDAAKLTDNMTFSDTTVSLASWICMPKYGEENHDLLVRFTRALFKGMDYSANEHYDEVSEWVSKQTATDYESVYNQRGDAQWLTGKEVAQGAADGTVAKYYEPQRDNFVKAGAVEKDPAPDVSEYVLFDVMIEAGK